MKTRLPALARVTGRVVGPRLSLALLPAWAVLGFAFTQLRDILDWPRMMAWAVAQAPLDAASTVAIATAAWGVLFARALRQALYTRDLAVLWRQSGTPLDWGIVLVPWLVLAALPLVALAWLWQSPVAVVGGLIGWCVVATGAARGGAPGWSLALAGTGGAGVLFALGRVHPAALLLLAGLGAAVLPVLGQAYLGGREVRTPASRALPGRPQNAVEALIRRDLLCLLRCAPGAVLAAFVPVLPVYGMLSTFRARGIFEGEAAVAAAIVLLCFCSPVTGWAFTVLRRRLASQFDAGWMPIDGTQRALALAFVGELLMLPTSMAVLAAMWPEGAMPVLRLMLCSSALTAAAVWATARTLHFLDDGSAAGWSLLTAFTVGVVAASGPMAGALGCIGIIAAGLGEAAGAFEHQRRLA